MEGCGRKIGPYDCCSIVTGDARELAKAIPDESVDLIFTDPPYIGDVLHLYEWLGDAGARILKPDTAMLCFFGTGFLADVLPALTCAGLRYRWLLDVKWAGLPLFNGRIAINGQRCLWLEKGQSVPLELVKDTWVVSQTSKTKTRYMMNSTSSGGQRIDGKQSWGKDMEIITKWIAAFISAAGIVLDSFAGMGTIPAACKMLGRHYLAFEIDPEVAERARERVRNTQPPLFVMEPEQTEMDLTIP